MLKLTTDKHEALCSLSVTAELLVIILVCYVVGSKLRLAAG